LVVVRYADDLVVDFEYRAKAERFLKDFGERLAKFGLELHPEKTRLIEFGRTPEFNRKQRGEGKKPENRAQNGRQTLTGQAQLEVLS
jgi:RNA-directed DNA polymerase